MPHLTALGVWVVGMAFVGGMFIASALWLPVWYAAHRRAERYKTMRMINGVTFMRARVK